VEGYFHRIDEYFKVSGSLRRLFLRLCIKFHSTDTVGLVLFRGLEPSMNKVKGKAVKVVLCCSLRRYRTRLAECTKVAYFGVTW